MLQKDKTFLNEKVLNKRKFLSLPTPAKSMYKRLVFRADDDGFVSSPCRSGGLENYKALCDAGFLIYFSDGLCVITDWEYHHIYTEFHKRTKHKTELSKIAIDSRTHRYRFVSDTAIRAAY